MQNIDVEVQVALKDWSGRGVVDIGEVKAALAPVLTRCFKHNDRFQSLLRRGRSRGRGKCPKVLAEWSWKAKVKKSKVLESSDEMELLVPVRFGSSS